MDGFFLVDKPTGMTSHDVVKHIKHKFQLKKVGHTGTLDPFASGLLIVCVGKGTKISHLLTANDKAYTGTIQLGKHYDTYDTTGKVTNEKDIQITRQSVMDAMASFIGSYEQEPPMHSAIKIDGQKLYKLAHLGKTIERPKRKVDIHHFDLVAFHDNEIEFSVTVSKGTYIRSLAVDLAHKLDTFGALSVLRRISIGDYHINQSAELNDLTNQFFVSLDDFFKDFPKLVLNAFMINLVKNGIVLDDRQTTTDKPFVVCDEEGTLIAYYEPKEENKYKPIIIF